MFATLAVYGICKKQGLDKFSEEACQRRLGLRLSSRNGRFLPTASAQMARYEVQ